MSQQLKIVVTPVADTSAQSVEQINKQLKTLQSKLNSLQLKTNIDTSALKTLKEFSSAVETYQKNLKNYNQTVKETQTVIKNADGTTEKVIQQHKKMAKYFNGKSRRLIIEIKRFARKPKKQQN